MSRDAECDVAVIGSGITGALAAWTLVAQGLRVVVLDRRDLAQGSTCASTALLQYDLDVPLHELIEKIGRDPAERAFTLGVEAVRDLVRIGARVGSPVEPRESLYFALDEGSLGGLEAELGARRRAGIDVRWVDAEELARRWGMRASGAILSSDAAQADPYALTHALLAGAVERGAGVFDRTEVKCVEPTPDGFVLRTDRGFVVTCGRIVHATGYEGAGEIPGGGVRLVSTYAAISEPIPDRSRIPDAMAWEHADPYLYARWVGDRLLMGGEDVPFRNERARDRLLGSKARTLVERFAEIYPGLPLEVAYAWCGTFATTEDGLGFIGAPPGRPREFHAYGFGGNGITFSTLAARMLGEWVNGRVHPDQQLFQIGR